MKNTNFSQMDVSNYFRTLENDHKKVVHNEIQNEF